MNRNNTDRFGFGFWLGWILWFAGSLVLAAALWTFGLGLLFGKIQGAELTLTWALSVFGTWFILLIPFMRKKEQIWKRLNPDEERSVDLWLLGMGAFIGLLVTSAVFWSLWYRHRVVDTAAGLDPAWGKAVFGSWLLCLLPLLVVMYRKTDQIFKEALARQSETGPKFRSIFIERSKRLLAEPVALKIKEMPPSLKEGHLVSLRLKDGRAIPHVFVINSKEILGVYDRVELGFDPDEVVDAELVRDPPAYEESRWLRMDGR